MRPQTRYIAVLVAVTTFAMLYISGWLRAEVLDTRRAAADQVAHHTRQSGNVASLSGIVQRPLLAAGLAKAGSTPAHQLLGLEMRDKRLVDAVRERFLQPSDPSTPYNLRKPEKTFFSQERQDKLVVKIFNNKTGGYFLEAGALDGERLSNTLYLERHLGWTGILVEPNPKTFEKLRNKNRRALLLNAGLSVHSRAARLNLDVGVKYPELATFVDKKLSKTDSNVVPVDCFPLFTVIAAAGNPVLDLLAIDVESVDLQVLQTVPWAEVRVRVLLVEINKIKGGIKTIEDYLATHGFKFYRTEGRDAIFYHPDFLTEDMNLQ